MLKMFQLVSFATELISKQTNKYATLDWRKVTKGYKSRFRSTMLFKLVLILTYRTCRYLTQASWLGQSLFWTHSGLHIGGEPRKPCWQWHTALLFSTVHPE